MVIIIVIMTIPIGLEARLILRNKSVDVNPLLTIGLNVHCQISEEKNLQSLEDTQVGY